MITTFKAIQQQVLRAFLFHHIIMPTALSIINLLFFLINRENPFLKKIKIQCMYSSLGKQDILLVTNHYC